LALIGLAVKEHGTADGDEVVVALSPILIGAAVEAGNDIPGNSA
jgi:hypothetical protein